MVLRFAILIAVLFLVYSFLLFHLYQLQIVSGDYYGARAESEHAAFLSTSHVNRGTIYFTDKNGNHLPAVFNKDFPLVYAVPRVVEDPQEAANIFSPIFKKSIADLEKIFSKNTDAYEVLVKKADNALVEKVTNLKFKGVYVDSVPGRFYPLGPLAAQALGFVGPEGQDNGETGHYGLEEFYNEKLTGTSRNISAQTTVSTNSPQDIILTIDPNIQIEAKKILGDLIQTYKALGGSVIVEDPQTGKILAMESLPDFDPNNYGSAPLANFLNPITQQIYEPGSVFKVITMATGIDSNKITPSTTYVDTGSVTLNGRIIQNYDLKTHGPYGKATMTNVIEHSINTGAVFAERQIGRDIFTKYLHNFGFAEKTGIDLPSELAGDLRRLSPKERDIAFATAAYGQGVAVTPLELIGAVSAIANGGNLMRPYLNSELVPKIVRRVVSEKTTREVAGMMISAVDKAQVAKVAGFSIAGKTGTAFIPDFKRGGYTNNVINTYVGFGPASQPKFVALIKLNEPQGAPLAGLSVVPAFQNIAQFILNYYGAEPDRLISSSSSQQ